MNSHAFMMKKVLIARGHIVIIDSQSSFPVKQLSTIFVNDTSVIHGNITDKESNDENVNDYDVVILLNESTTSLAPDLSELDCEYVTRESELFLRSCNYFYTDNTFWVNPLESYAKSGLKPVQLKAAKNVGLSIPETIISNNPNEIVQFIENCSGKVITKPFSSMTWQEKGNHHYFPTTLISVEDIKNNLDSVKLCPLIYQECVNRSYEVRVTIMGATVIAAKLTKDSSQSVDWRVINTTDNLHIEKIEIPEVVKKQCLALTKDLNLIYGCIDFIVDQNSNYTFLEINNAGQFIWKELSGDCFPMLHIFCDFIESRNPYFQWDGEEKYYAKKLLADINFEHDMKLEYGDSPKIFYPKDLAEKA
jgi:glutathione synthase/RimK-type ligase-like ATP-grasp enzyme